MAGFKFYRCPGCTKKGVWLKLGADDCWCCRYCEWYAYAAGEEDSDFRNRNRLAAINPNGNIWVTDLPRKRIFDE